MDNLVTTVYGNSDAELSPEGIKQAERLGEILPSFDVIYSSPLIRAIETAKIATNTSGNNISKQSNFVILDDLRELDFGHFTPEIYDGPPLEGEPIRYYISLKKDIFEGEYGAETHFMFHNRVKMVFSNIIDEITKNNHKKVAIFTHAGVLRSLTQYFLKLTKGGYQNTEIALLQTQTPLDTTSWELTRIEPKSNH